MQIIKVGTKCYLFIRYGRIGETGVINYKELSESGAIAFFEKQFRTKTGNHWRNNDTFTKIDGKYFMAEIETAEISESESKSVTDSVSEEHLDERVEHLMKLISNTTYMTNSLIQLEIDISKMPLGKIKQSQIDQAYEILNKINKNLGNNNLLVKLSSEFYTLIPIVCGRSAPPVINNSKLISKNVELLDELSQMVFGTAAITKMKKNGNNLVKYYEDLNTEIVPLDPIEDEWYSILSNYVKNSKAPTHNFKYDIDAIYEISRNCEREIYDKYCKKIGNRVLLFHGTRMANVCSILQTNFVCDPSKLNLNIPISGKMFGLGTYFSNSSSKSIQYTAYNTSDNIACLFVSEVALGKQLKKKQPDSSLRAETMPKGYHSTWGIGQSGYEDDDYDEFDDGTKIPSGKLKKLNHTGCSLLYDEFIVYNTEQINTRFIITLKVSN